MPITPITKHKILQGSKSEVETELNYLKKEYSVIIQGMSTVINTDFAITTTVIVELYPNPN